MQSALSGARVHSVSGDANSMSDHCVRVAHQTAKARANHGLAKASREGQNELAPGQEIEPR